MPLKFGQAEAEKIIDYSKISTKPTCRKILHGLLAKPKISALIDFIDFICTLVVVSVYIISTYDGTIIQNYVWGSISFLIHAHLLVEYFIRLYSSKDRKIYFQSIDSFVDIISNIPFILVRFINMNPLLDDPNSIIAKYTNLFSLIRILKLERIKHYLDSDTDKQLTNIIVIFLTLVILSAGTLQLLERTNVMYLSSSSDEVVISNSSFHFYIYFIMITISSLGYQSYFTSVSSRILIIVLISVSVIIVPSKSSQLLGILSSKSFYASKIYKASKDTPHIVLTGSITDVSATNILTELFHHDHLSQLTHAILLAPQIPDAQMEAVIRNPDFQTNLIYLQGDPLKENDLKRCQVEKAKAVILLCNKQSEDPNEEDAKTILQAMFIKKYLKDSKAIKKIGYWNVQPPSVKLCMQILRPEGKTHYYLSNKQTKLDQVVCIEELKLGLLARSCLCPGLPAMIHNLISSNSPPAAKPEDGEWLEEYLKGKSYEIYRVFLPKKYKGKSFSWIASRIYSSFRAILFAIEIITPDGNKMFINPGDYILQGLSKITGYIIAQTKDVDELLTTYQAFVVEESEFVRKGRRGGVFIHSDSRRTNSNLGIEKGYIQAENDDDDQDDDEAESILKRNENLNNPIAGELSRMEGRFHLAPGKIALSDVTFRTMRNNILAINHIIFCGSVPNLSHFIAPLRLKYIEKYPPIVLLHPTPPTEKQWNPISMYPEIYYVKGSAMSHKDLLRANIMFAKNVVILAPECSEINRFLKFDASSDKASSNNGMLYSSRQLTRDQEDLLDAKTIFKYKAITKLRSDIQVIVELVCSSNTGFLINNPKDYAIMRKFGFSQVIQPLIINSLKGILLLQAPIYASGSIFLSSMFDYLICQNQTFERLLEYLLKYHNIMPLGLYRKPGCKDNLQPYVLTNPDPDTKLTKYDIVFVLAEKQPPENSSEWEYIEISSPLMKKDPHRFFKEDDEKELNLHEDVEKDITKNKAGHRDTEHIVEKIKELVEDLSNLKTEIDILKKVVNERQNSIVEKIKSSIDLCLNELLSKYDSKVINDDTSENISSLGSESNQLFF